MSKSGEIGKKHVVDVCCALQRYINNDSIEAFSEPVRETVKYIVELYPNSQAVRSNYETDNPDSNPNLQITLQNGEMINVNLFYIKGHAAVQPKNLGAKSFLRKYFLSPEMQIDFDVYFNEVYELYLKSIMNVKGHRDIYDKVAILKSKVNTRYPKFEKEINIFRRSFLFSLREFCFQIMKEAFNEGTNSIQHAFDELMMLHTTNIITRYKNESECLRVEQWQSAISTKQAIQLYKKGNDTIGIRAGREALTIRFKFESGPASSVKLATSYEQFPVENSIVEKNLNVVKKFERAIGLHQPENRKNDSNAIGKCNEAMVYYRFLVEKPTIHQVDDQGLQVMLETYAPYITLQTLQAIQQSSAETVERIGEYLRGKYGAYELEAIQLVPDSYVEDHLDTTDLKIMLRVDGKYIEEDLSLKAISKSNVRITVKNPGAGSILGPLYFDVGSLALVTDETKIQFEQQQLTHAECLAKVSEALGESLLMASQEKLRKGLAAIRGTAITIVTNYKNGKTLILEHDVIQGEIEVLPKSPTPIQTTLRWHDKQEELSLRVKFSGSQSKGWSSLKLACEYKVHV